MAGQLDTVAVLTRQYKFGEVFSLDAMGHGETERVAPEDQGTVEVGNVDAVLIDAGFH